MSGCVSSGRPWIPPEETAQAAQAWKKTNNPELKRNWIFIDEQFVEVNNTLPIVSDQNREKIIVPNNFKPQPQKFFGESEEIAQANQDDKKNSGGVLITLFTALYQSKKIIGGICKLATSQDQNSWAKQIENQQFKSIMQRQRRNKIEIRIKGNLLAPSFIRIRSKRIGLPSLNKL